jgi:4Fe-4S single cluster protein
MNARRPHPSNVPGDFYVEDTCCTLCGVPDIVAPDLFTMGEDNCFVSKQPGTPEELDRMIEAIRCSEFACIRYRGTSLAVQVRLVDQIDGSQCDHLPPELVRRNNELAKAQRRRLLLLEWRARAAKRFASWLRWLTLAR